MAPRIGRRAALKRVGLAGAGVVVSGGVFRGQPDEVMHVARTLREKQLPCNALI